MKSCQPWDYDALLTMKAWSPDNHHNTKPLSVPERDPISCDTFKPWMHDNVKPWQHEALTTIVVWSINKFGFSPKMRLKSYWLCGCSSTNPREARVWCPGMCPRYAVPRACVPVCTLYLDFLCNRNRISRIACNRACALLAPEPFY